ICVLGRDVFGAALTAVENRQAQGHPLKVRVGITAETARGCHVVFVADSEQRRIAPTLRALASEPILTVSDIDGFIDAGGAIGIVQGEQRLEFEINRDALDQAQLKASSNLLRLARNLANLKGRN
ncbi:MAG: YfiR family protein, partial [Rhodocyclaceae bacterium]